VQPFVIVNYQSINMTSFFDFIFEGEPNSAQLVIRNNTGITKYYVFLSEPRLLERFNSTYIFTTSENEVQCVGKGPTNSQPLVDAIAKRLKKSISPAVIAFN
jgi:hypothetical protein